MSHILWPFLPSLTFYFFGFCRNCLVGFVHDHCLVNIGSISIWAQATPCVSRITKVSACIGTAPFLLDLRYYLNGSRFQQETHYSYIAQYMRMLHIPVICKFPHTSVKVGFRNSKTLPANRESHIHWLFLLFYTPIVSVHNWQSWIACEGEIESKAVTGNTSIRFCRDIAPVCRSDWYAPTRTSWL
mgnify:FL=1